MEAEGPAEESELTLSFEDENAGAQMQDNWAELHRPQNTRMGVNLTQSPENPEEDNPI